MKRIIYLSILAVILAFVITLIVSTFIVRREAGAAEAEPAGVVIGETMTVTRIEAANPIYQYTYGVIISYPKTGKIARKRLWLRVEYWEAEQMLRILGAASPNVIFSNPYAPLFHWQWINDQDLSTSGWSIMEYRWATSKLWCDLLGCRDYTYKLFCRVYGRTPGYLECMYQKWE